MSPVNEPVLAIDDIQGHIYPGFGNFHSIVAIFCLNDAVAGRESLRTLIPHVTTMESALGHRMARGLSLKRGFTAPVQDKPSLSISLSRRALKQWGHDHPAQDKNFLGGMLGDLKSIGDPVNGDGAPLDWKFGTDESTSIDLVLVVGQNQPESLQSAFDEWSSSLKSGWSLLQLDFGRRRKGDEEFFGFKDGVSQPAIRGTDAKGNPVARRSINPSDKRSELFTKPGQRLLWPGNFILGYPREVAGSLQSGSIFEPPQPWMRNGSYLVYRRLNQDVELFNSALRAMTGKLNEAGEKIDDVWLGSRLVGRWKDGTPVIQSPEYPKPDSDIGDDSYRNNHFQYAFTDEAATVTDDSGTVRVIPETKFDPMGTTVPLMSHIRKVNPRAGRSEEGPEKHPQKLMLRRGVTFGKELLDDPDGERGLLFLAYQSSIADQFLFVQSTWANSEKAPTTSGRDPIIGQDGKVETERNLKLVCPSGAHRSCSFNGRWVVATAGAYLFTPSISGLQYICS